MRTEAGKPMKAAEEGLVSGDDLRDYIDWRVDNPSDDIMTELLNVEFVDEHGVTRRLTRDELLIYINVVAGAGNDTTTRLIGWAGKVLAEHPDQRRQLVEDPALIPQAVEELVCASSRPPRTWRATSPATSSIYGQTVPQGAVMMMLIGAANRDHRQFPPDGDVFDINREHARSTWRSASAPTSAWARRWPASRAGSRWRRSSSGSRSGRSTWPNAVFSPTSTDARLGHRCPRHRP